MARYNGNASQSKTFFTLKLDKGQFLVHMCIPQEFGKIWNLFLRNARMVCHKPDSTWQLSCFVINCFWSRLWQQPLFQMVCNYANIIYWSRECTLRTVISVSYSWKWFISFESCKLTADQYFSCNRCSSKTCFSLFLYLDKKS